MTTNFTAPRFSIDFFSIEPGRYYNCKENVVHISGTLWRDFQDIRLTEYTFLTIPISEFVKGYAESGIEFVYECMGEVQQYEDEEISTEEAEDIFANYFDGKKPTEMDYSQITRKTPCGIYITES